MNILNEVINRSYPGAELSCRECGSSDVTALEDHGVSMSNPLGERRMSIVCGDCGQTDEAIRVEDVRETVKAWLTTNVTRYICCFDFSNEPFFTETSDGIGEFKDGFWVNADMRFTKNSDCVYWIPPGKIQYIEKDKSVKRLSE